MKWNHYKSKLLLRYTVSYLSIFLVPLIFLTVIIYQNAVDNLRSEIEQKNVNQLVQAKTVIDGRMKELQDIASRIAYDEQLTPYRVQHPYFSREAIAALDKYKATNAIISELFLYIRGDDNIYSTQGMEHLDVFTERYKFHNWKPEALYRDLNETQHPTMRPAESVTQSALVQKSLLSFMVPITPNKPYPHGTVLYFIDESSLTDLIDSVLGDFQGMTVIFDEQGRILAANAHQETIDSGDASSLSRLEPGIHSIRAGSQRHSVVSVRSSANGWTYVTSMPSDQFFSRIFHIQTFIVIVFSVVVAFGTLIAVLLARRQYFPISDLMEFVKSKKRGAAAPQAPASNELEWIRETLRDYSLRIDMQEPYARNQCLYMLLKNGTGNDLPLELMHTLGIRLEHSYYFAVHLGWNGTPGPKDGSERSAMIEPFSDAGLPELDAHVYGIELPHPDRLALIVGFNAEQDAQAPVRIRGIVDELRRIAGERYDSLPSIGVGTGYTDPADLNQSYVEATSAFENRVSSEAGSVVYFDDLSHFHDGGEAFWLPKEVLLKLAQSLKQGNLEVAAHMVSTALTNLRAGVAPMPLLRCICFDLLNTMLKTASELGIRDVVQVIPQVTTFESLEELEEKLFVLAANICEQVERKLETEERFLLDRIMAYIEENYADYSLSLESISEKYAVSPSYFSRSFKEKAGINFSKYIWQKRLDEVMHQLKSTSDPLKDIIARVGYLDPPNFIRKFKKETGLTPGQFRKMYGNQESAAALAADEE
ncbi:AraC family transcriptional regulator [Paenibacillus antri]|uniref:AraC family transcriptional regulator n=1 Tax=Paenibacillus antri TaxID=2582848 RepID=A0A5R9G189_9BACL|nr:helix-turn-helix domain-containing protein [Paenibacillus antri]TLS50102.1 AraC family transcriptional regulator [Paenibacillus antri]